MSANEDISDLVRTLADLLGETGLSEIEYAKGDWRIRVAKSGLASAVPLPMAAATAAAPQSAVCAPEAAPSGAITSPMVGTVYRSQDPGAAPFVEVGDEVTEGQTLLLIEAMKTFNEIRAPRAGRIVKIMVENGAPVEYGDPLLVLS